MHSFLVFAFSIHFISPSLIIRFLSVFHGVLFVHGGEDADHALKQEQNVVERVDLELFVKRSTEMLLVLICFEEGG